MTELHNRLNQIIECSSQLIFVTADTVSRQQKALTEFLSNQADDTDVSFFKADGQSDSDSYRRSIYSQITGNYTDTKSKKLSQLLNLDKHKSSDNGLFLICISKAELLHTDFVKELWDWTVQARQYGAGTRLSILLFCDNDWAQRALTYLPNNGDAGPIIISKDTQDAVGFDVNALESLMNDKHSWLSTKNQPLVTKKWFLTFVGSIFLVTFASLMSILYLNESEDASLVAQSEPVDATDKMGSEREKNAVKNETSESENYSAEELFATDFNPSTGSRETFSEPLGEGYETNNEQPKKVDSGTDNSIETALAVEEHHKKATINASLSKTSSVKQSAPLTNYASDIDDKNLEDSTVRSAPITSQPATPSAVPVAGSVKSKSIIDFKVDDITNVNQLSATLSNSDENAPQNLSATTFKEKTNIDYRFDETTLLSLPSNAVVLQLSGIQNPVVLENYLKNNKLEASTWVYETQRYGGPWYVVTYSQAFDSIESAINNLPGLPDVIKESQPFAKSINQIQKEIRSR